jgi:nucleoside phosphorylase
MDSNRELTSREQTGAVSNSENAGRRADAARLYGPHPDQRDFKVAILCALPLEASIVLALFDKQWSNHTYSRASGDSNAYSTGMIGHHNVVLVHMPSMGKVAAAIAAADLRASYSGIQLALVVGICGGAPFEGQLREDILLGDVVISEGLVQYDFGRQLPNRFVRKDTPRDTLPRPRPEIFAALAKLKTRQGRSWLCDKTSEYLRVLGQELNGTIIYPGVMEDRLFKSTYRHKHHRHSECTICANDEGGDDICDEATGMNCEQLKCDEQELVFRVRVSQPCKPVVHFGLIASGDTVMKSGEDRDEISARDGVIAFEMEGVGVWEKFPSSLVIKGICDYADSHKSKIWQGYAAATAAAVMKGFLENWTIGIQFWLLLYV